MPRIRSNISVRKRGVSTRIRGASPRKHDVLSRKRGAQIGNTNALKHGIYAHHLNSLTPSDLAGFSTNKTAEEIQLIRVMVSRHLQMRKNNPPRSPEETLTDLRVISFAVGRLASLMRLQRNLPDDENIAYSGNWMEELLNDLDSERGSPDEPTDLIQ